LQRREQDVFNATSLVNVAKNIMPQLRSGRSDQFLEMATSFCIQHGAKVPTMYGDYAPYGKSARYACVENQTNDDYFKREIYIGVINQIS